MEDRMSVAMDSDAAAFLAAYRSHPGEQVLLAHVTTGPKPEVEQHLSGCAYCRERLAAVAALPAFDVSQEASGPDEEGVEVVAVWLPGDRPSWWVERDGTVICRKVATTGDGMVEVQREGRVWVLEAEAIKGPAVWKPGMSF